MAHAMSWAVNTLQQTNVCDKQKLYRLHYTQRYRNSRKTPSAGMLEKTPSAGIFKKTPN